MWLKPIPHLEVCGTWSTTLLWVSRYFWLYHIDDIHMIGFTTGRERHRIPKLLNLNANHSAISTSNEMFMTSSNWYNWSLIHKPNHRVNMGEYHWYHPPVLWCFTMSHITAQTRYQGTTFTTVGSRRLKIKRTGLDKVVPSGNTLLLKMVHESMKIDKHMKTSNMVMFPKMLVMLN